MPRLARHARAFLSMEKRKPYHCLQTATIRERVTLAPLSRRQKLHYLAVEVGTLAFFVVSSLGIGWWLRSVANG